MIVGGLVVIGAFGFGARTVIDRIQDSTTFDTPGTASMHIGSGRYAVYTDGRDLSATITVTDAHGVELPIDIRFGDETITTDGRTFENVAEFTAPSDGLYSVTITTDSQGPCCGRALVTHPIKDTLRSLVPNLLAALGGSALFIVGIVLLIVGTVRRDKVRYARS
jgi:hypothetical protein